MKVTKQHINRLVKFWGYDDVIYTAEIRSILNGIILITYFHPSFTKHITARLTRKDANQRLLEFTFSS